MARRITFAACVLFISTSLAFACGTERWAVKVGTDRDAHRVDLDPETTTIADLTAITPPQHPNSRKSSRFTPTELKTFRITGVLTVIKKEKDEDYHLVIADPDDEELTMIVESAAPGCATDSQFEQQITDVRRAIDEKLGTIKGKKKNPNVTVTVTGVGFFDPIHGQEGVAPNGIELHPLLSIEFQ
jgi:hypothetical protein